jgi:hypothetical protein
VSVAPSLLSDAIKRNDAAGVRELLRQATEADRRACAKALRPLLRGPELPLPEPVMLTNRRDAMNFILTRMTGHGHEHVEPSAGEREREEWHRIRSGAAFLAAALGLAGGAAAAVRAADDHPLDFHRPYAEELDAIAGVLADRHPEWLADFVNRRLNADVELGLRAWPLARRLARLGVIDRPDVPGYATRFPVAIGKREWPPSGERRWVVTPHDGLLADPGLLEDEVWRLFTVPDAAWRLDEDWAEALARLAAEGHLDRDRLIDATLDAFTRDFAPNRVGWYALFHDQMNPSVEEMAARTGKYLGLLAVSAKPGVTLGQRAAGRLADAGLLAADQLLEASAPALLFPQKSVAVAQLKLIGKIATRQPGARGRALATAAQAFAHQRDDVQEAALFLIRKHGIPDEPELAEIRALAGALSPSLAGDAAALGLGPAPGLGPVPGFAAPDEPGAAPHERDAALVSELDEMERRISALPASSAAGLRAALATARRGEVPGSAPAGPSAGPALGPPVDDPEELVQLLTQLMEDASDPLAVERAVAGAVRLATLPARDRSRLAGPLLRRAEKRVREDYDGPFNGREITTDMTYLTLAWGAGRPVRVDRTRRGWGSAAREAVRLTGEAKTMAGILSARVWEACTLVSNERPVRLLAEPESERGVITPDRLLDRLACWPASPPVARPPRYDLEVALLRLAPGAGDEFWSAWARMQPATAQAARRAYTGALAPLCFEPVVGEPEPWHPHSVNYGNGYPHVLAALTGPSADSAAQAESHSWRLLTALASPLRDYPRLYAERYANTHYDPIVAAWPLLCPWQPELAAAHLLRPLSDGLKPGPSPAATAAGCLASPGQALGIIGHLALVTGLASAEPSARIAAAQAWAQASTDGRLDPALAAAAIVTGVTGGAFKLNRVANGLQHASPGPLAGYRIIETICAAAGALIPAKPANLHLLFELAARIGATTGMPELPAAITGLASQKGASRLVTEAQRLANSRDGAAPAHGQVITQALTALLY